MTAGQHYNLILEELENDFGDDPELEKYKTKLLVMSPQCYPAIWESYMDKDNMFSLCFIVEAASALFESSERKN